MAKCWAPARDFEPTRARHTGAKRGADSLGIESRWGAIGGRDGRKSCQSALALRGHPANESPDCERIANPRNTRQGHAVALPRRLRGGGAALTPTSDCPPARGPDTTSAETPPHGGRRGQTALADRRSGRGTDEEPPTTRGPDSATHDEAPRTRVARGGMSAAGVAHAATRRAPTTLICRSGPPSAPVALPWRAAPGGWRRAAGHDAASTELRHRRGTPTRPPGGPRRTDTAGGGRRGAATADRSGAGCPPTPSRRPRDRDHNRTASAENPLTARNVGCRWRASPPGRARCPQRKTRLRDGRADAARSDGPQGGARCSVGGNLSLPSSTPPRVSAATLLRVWPPIVAKPPPT